MHFYCTSTKKKKETLYECTETNFILCSTFQCVFVFFRFFCKVKHNGGVDEYDGDDVDENQNDGDDGTTLLYNWGQSQHTYNTTQIHSLALANIKTNVNIIFYAVVVIIIIAVAMLQS